MRYQYIYCLPPAGGRIRSQGNYWLPRAGGCIRFQGNYCLPPAGVLHLQNKVIDKGGVSGPLLMKQKKGKKFASYFTSPEKDFFFML